MKEHQDYFSLTLLSQELRRSEFFITNWGYIGAKAPLLSTTPPFAIVTCESGGMRRHPMVICLHTFAIQRPESLIACGDALRLSAPRHLETPSPIDMQRPMWSSAPFLEMSASSGWDFLVSQTNSVNPDPWSQVAGRNTPSDYPYKDNFC